MLGSFFRILSGPELWASTPCYHKGTWNSPQQGFLMEVDEATEAARKCGWSNGA